MVKLNANRNTGNTGNTGTKCEICSKLTIKIPEQDHGVLYFGVFIVNFEHTCHLIPVSLLLNLKM